MNLNNAQNRFIRRIANGFLDALEASGSKKLLSIDHNGDSQEDFAVNVEKQGDSYQLSGMDGFDFSLGLQATRSLIKSLNLTNVSYDDARNALEEIDKLRSGDTKGFDLDNDGKNDLQAQVSTKNGKDYLQLDLNMDGGFDDFAIYSEDSAVLASFFEPMMGLFSNLDLYNLDLNGIQTQLSTLSNGSLGISTKAVRKLRKALGKLSNGGFHPIAAMRAWNLADNLFTQGSLA